MNLWISKFAELIFFVWLISSIVSAVFCSKMAFEKGYSRGCWAVLGFFFSWLTVICLAGLPRKDKNFMELTHNLKTIRFLLEEGKQVESKKTAGQVDKKADKKEPIPIIKETNFKIALEEEKEEEEEEEKQPESKDKSSGLCAGCWQSGNCKREKKAIKKGEIITSCQGYIPEG